MNPTSKIFIPLVIVFSLVVCSGGLLAQEQKSGELSLGGAVFPREEFALTGMISLGFHTTGRLGVGIELGAILAGGGVLSANLVLSSFDLERVILYATGGVWLNEHGETGLNIGGGLKLKLSENLAIRAEYRSSLHEDEGGAGFIYGGLSLFL